MERLRPYASQLPLVWMALAAALVTAVAMIIVVMGGLLLGRLNPSHYQLLYITQAKAENDNLVTMYVHDLRANIRHAVLKNYLGWGSDVAWSPDGRHIAFSQFQPGVVRRDILLLDLYTGAQTLISEREPPRDYNSPSWSPDGRQLVYHGADPATGDIDLYIYNRDTGQQRHLDTGDGQHWQPVWSPDGTTIIFAGRTAQGDSTSDLYRVDLETSGVTLLVAGDLIIFSPMWSPDGTTIIFAGRTAPFSAGQYLSLFVANVSDGSNMLLPIRIAGRQQGSDFSNREPAWSPDGRSIAFVGFDPDYSSTVNSRIMIVPAAGGQAQFLTEPGVSYRQPAWRP